MADTWKISYADARQPGRRLHAPFATSDSDFASKLRDLLSDIYVSNVSATLPNGTELDEAALRAAYMK